SIEIAKSAPKIRPRKRSSVFKCSKVVENTQTVEVPQCARIITAKADQISDAPEDESEQHSNAQTGFALPRPTRCNQRAQQSAEAARSHQQAHSEQPCACRRNVRNRYSKYALRHHRKEHPGCSYDANSALQ